MDAASGAPLLTQPERLERRLKEIPAEPGCYLMRDGDDRILYVGKSKALRSRVRSYFRSRHDLSPRIRLMTRQVCEIEFIVTDSEAEALVLESNLIKNHQPHFNVLLKDDKKYPYLSASPGVRPIRGFLSPVAAASAALWIAFTGPMSMWGCCVAPCFW